MNPKTTAFLLICVSLVFYTAGEYYSKVWSLNPSYWLVFLVTLNYSIGAVLWLPALRLHGQLSALSAVRSCLSIIICVVLGVFVFKEKLSSQQMVGVVLAIIASYLTF